MPFKSFIYNNPFNGVKFFVVVRNGIYLKIILYVVVLSVVTACSTKKNTFMRRSYHNLTSHYNGYWNARDNMETTVDEMIKAGSDNFLSTLTVNYYGNKKEAQSMKPSLDGSIEKAYTMVRRHSMQFDGAEQVKWIDDCHFLIGQCYFYQKDFNNARRMFQYVISNFPNSLLKYDADLWLAMTYTQNGEYEKAANVFETLQKSVDDLVTSPEVRKQLPIAFADFYILQGKLNDAIPYLEQALALNKMDRRIKQRVNFILGQVYHDNEDYPAALAYYKKSTKGADFRISFNSRISMAQCADLEDTESVMRVLQKLLKEVKYEEYRDQIYYAMSEIARREGDTLQLIEDLIMSVGTSVSNDYQKAISANQLADLYFSMKKYIEAQPYYDTTVQFLPQDYPGYSQINQKTTVLGDLVDNLMIVQVEDSLQAVANMDPQERTAMIDSIIEHVKEQERIEKELEMQRQRNYSSSLINQYENQQTQSRLGQTVSWYFYSPQTVSSGINEFKKKWGDRKYEDLWALKDKQTFSWDDLGEVDTTAVDTTSLNVVTDNKDPQFYLQNLPLTEETMELSNGRIEDALYQAGFIAMDRLSDYKLSNECFGQLVVRYPETEHKLTAYIMMYLNCTETSDEPCKTDLTDKITTEYPESDFAILLKDPSHIIKMTDKLEASGNMYTDTYYAFEDKMYDVVDLYSEEGLALDDEKYNPKFLYISALSGLSQRGEEDSLSLSMLQTIVDDYPNDDVTPMAQELLTLLMPEEEVVLDSATMAIMEEERIQKEKLEEEIALYKYVCKANYFYVLLVKSNANTKAVSTRVSDYLIRYHKLDNLSSVSRVFDDNYEMITVSMFSDCNQAMTFYENAIINNYIYSGITEDDYIHFVISQENYPVFYKNKGIKAYSYFFEEKLLPLLEDE